MFRAHLPPNRPCRVLGDSVHVRHGCLARAGRQRIDATGSGHQVASTPPPAIAAPERGRGRGGNGGGGSGAAAPEPDSAVVEVLENTLWNRQLGVMSEEIVAALVCQIFEGARRTPPVVPPPVVGIAGRAAKQRARSSRVRAGPAAHVTCISNTRLVLANTSC